VTLHALISEMIVPPADLAIVALLALAIGGRRRRAGAIACLVALVLLAVPAVAQTLIVSLERGVHPVLDPAAPDAIVVLGGELEVDANGHAYPGALTLQRLRAAAALQRRTGLPVLVSGGSVRRDAPPLADVMARSLELDFGVPVRWVEDRSATTWENAADTAAILLPLHVRSVLVVTHAWHMRRAMMAFARVGLPAIPVAVARDPAPTWSPGAWVPCASAWMMSYYALHEWIGCLWYAARDWAERHG
jgi:uncharacterized SAM-binding protein YcdF (DUF218 family)